MLSAIIAVVLVTGMAGAWTGLFGTGIYLATRKFAGSKKLLRHNIWVLGPIPEKWVTELDDMIDQLEEHWAARVGSRTVFRQAIDGLTLEYVEGSYFFVTEHGSPKKVRGVFLSKKYCKMAIRDGGLGNTATTHEIGHIVVAHTPPHYDADPDHEGNRWLGWTAEITAVTDEVGVQFQVITPAGKQENDSDVKTCGSCNAEA